MGFLSWVNIWWVHWHPQLILLPIPSWRKSIFFLATFLLLHQSDKPHGYTMASVHEGYYSFPIEPVECSQKKYTHLLRAALWFCEKFRTRTCFLQYKAWTIVWGVSIYSFSYTLAFPRINHHVRVSWGGYIESWSERERERAITLVKCTNIWTRKKYWFLESGSYWAGWNVINL